MDPGACQGSCRCAKKRPWRSRPPSAPPRSKSVPFLALPRPQPASVPVWPSPPRALGPRSRCARSLAATVRPPPGPSIVLRIVPSFFHLAPRLSINGGGNYCDTEGHFIALTVLWTPQVPPFAVRPHCHYVMIACAIVGACLP